MARFEITAPDGHKYEINAPENASEQDAVSFLQSQLASGGVSEPEPPAAEGDYPELRRRMAAHPVPNPNPIGQIAGDVGEAWQRVADDITTMPTKGEIRNPIDMITKGAHQIGDIIGAVFSPVASAQRHLVSEPISAAGKSITKAFPSAEQIDSSMMGMRPGSNPLSLVKKLPAETPLEKAVKKVGNRFSQDEKGGGLSARDALDKINSSSEPLMLADVGGENVRGLGGNVARQPGASRNIAKNNLELRDEGSQDRLDGLISRSVNSGPSMFQTVKTLLTGRSQAARPAYQTVEQMDGIWSPRLQEFIGDPALKSGLARGYEIERLNSLAEARKFDPTQMGIDLDQEGNVVLKKVPNMRVLDMAKQGLDAMISEERNEITGRLSARGVSLDKVRRAYVSEIDKMDTAGLYRGARDAWAGPSASMDAVRHGRAIFGANPEEIAADFAELSPANQEFYRLGVADTLRERLSKAGFSADESKQLINNNWMKKQLKPLFRSDDEFKSFVDSVSNERKMFGTRREVLGGSQTQFRNVEDQSNQGDTIGHIADIGHKIATQNVLGAIRGVWRFYRDRGLRPDHAVNEEIAKILFTPNLPSSGEAAQRLSGRYQPPARPPIPSQTLDLVEGAPYASAIASTLGAKGNADNVNQTLGQ